MMVARRLRVTQIKSGIGYHVSQKETLRTLGLRRLNQTVEVVETPTVRGMLRKVGHLLRVEEVTGEA
jgi:large subunit ribosomal protein L30